MPTRIGDLLARIASIECELELEFQRAESNCRYRIEAGRVRFTQEVRDAH